MSVPEREVTGQSSSMTLPSPRVRCSVTLPDSARVLAVFADGSVVDLTENVASLIELGATVAMHSLGSVPVLAAELGDTNGVAGLDAVLEHSHDETAGRVELIEGDGALFTLEHLGGDELLSTDAALTLVAVAAAALIEQ